MVTNVRMTVGDLLRSWLDNWAQHTVRPTTLEDYEVTVRLHLLPALGALEARKLTTAHVQQHYADKLAAGTSARVIKQCHQRLAQALTYGVTRGLLTHNVARAVLRPRVACAEKVGGELTMKISAMEVIALRSFGAPPLKGVGDTLVTPLSILERWPTPPTQANWRHGCNMPYADADQDPATEEGPAR